MFCRNCGSPMDDGAAFCGRCGTSVVYAPGMIAESPAPPVKAPVDHVRPVKEPGSGLGNAGMVLGIVSCVLGCLCFSCNPLFSVSVMAMLSGVVGLILSILARRKVNTIHGKNPYATVGMVTSIVGVGVSLICGIWYLMEILFVLVYYVLLIIIMAAESAAPVLGPSVPM